MRTKTLVWIFGILALTSLCFADQAVVNANDWKDVYSGVWYARYNNMEPHILDFDVDSAKLVSVLDKKEAILLIESYTPGIANFETLLHGFNVGNIREDNLNIELAYKANVRKFIVVDEGFGYNAIMVAPYAVKERYYVLFSSKKNNDAIIKLLETKQATDVIAFGYVNQELATRLKAFGAEFINKGTKTENNLEIAERMLNCASVNQVMLTDGTFIEKSLIDGHYPIIILEESELQDEIISFVKDKGIKAGVVIGKSVIRTAKELKSKAELDTVILKFGEGVTNTEDSFAAIEPLNLYLIGKEFDTLLSIDKIEYNAALKEMEVYYTNDGKKTAFLISSLSVSTPGKPVVVVADKESQVIDPAETKGISYPADLTGWIADSRKINAKLTTYYGAEPKELNKIKSRSFSDIEKTALLDNSRVELESIGYNGFSNQIVLRVKNYGKANAYVDADVIANMLDGYGDKYTLNYRTNKPLPVKAGDSGTIRLDAANVERENLKDLDVRLRFGERKELLVKSENSEGVDISQRALGNMLFLFTSTGFGLALALCVIAAGILVFIKRPLIKRALRMRKLVLFVKENLEKGFSEAVIKNHLLKHKYPRRIVEEAFSKIK